MILCHLNRLLFDIVINLMKVGERLIFVEYLCDRHQNLIGICFRC